jgi:hypothetical protein
MEIPFIRTKTEEESYSFSSEDTKDDSGEIQLTKKPQSFQQKTTPFKGSKLERDHSFQIYKEKENIDNFIEKRKYKNEKQPKELKSSNHFSYPFVQDLKGPIYFSKGKSGALFLAKIRRIQSKINRNVFDKGSKYLYRIPKDVPDVKFWNQRFYYYSKFDEGIKMDYESIFFIKK